MEKQVSSQLPEHYRPKLPRFGGDNGFIYPAVARILWVLTWASPARCFNLSATGVDALILCNVVVVVGIATFLGFRGISQDDSSSPLIWICVLLTTYILLVILVVNASEFYLGYSRNRAPWPLNRGIVLKTVNLGEIICSYGILFFIFQGLFPDSAGKMNEPFSNIFDAVYFSTVTGATLGYGDFSPKGWVPKALVMSEVLFVLIILLGILSSLKSRTWGPADLEQMGGTDVRGSEKGREAEPVGTADRSHRSETMDE